MFNKKVKCFLSVCVFLIPPLFHPLWLFERRSKLEVISPSWKPTESSRYRQGSCSCYGNRWVLAASQTLRGLRSYMCTHTRISTRTHLELMARERHSRNSSQANRNRLGGGEEVKIHSSEELCVVFMASGRSEMLILAPSYGLLVLNGQNKRQKRLWCWEILHLVGESVHGLNY